MDEEDEVGQKLIGLPETILMTLLVGGEELLEFAILMITLGAGIIVVEVMNIAVGAALEMYMLLRGGKGVMKMIVQPIGSFINGISGCLLPGKTVAMLVGIGVINHPEFISKAVKLVGKMAGSVVTAGGALAGEMIGTAPGKTGEEGASAARQRIAMVMGGGPKMPIKK